MKPGRYYPGNEYAPEDWYLLPDEAITYLGVERDQFYEEIWDTLTKYRLPDAKYKLFYRLSDLDKKRKLRVENAARNILQKGLQVWAGTRPSSREREGLSSDSESPLPLKREATGL